MTLQRPYAQASVFYCWGLCLLLLLIGLAPGLAFAQANAESSSEPPSAVQTPAQNNPESAVQINAQETSQASESLAPSQAQVSARRADAGVNANDVLVMTLSLGLIVALIFFLAWLARRFGGMRAVGIKDMQVLSAMPLGAREKLALVEVKGKQILIGVTHANISHIHTFSDAELTNYVESAGQQAPAQSEFALKLKQMLARDKPEPSDLSRSNDV